MPESGLVEALDLRARRERGEREREALKTLRAILAEAIPKAPGIARQLAGIDPAAIDSYAALSRIPVIRKSDLAELQAGEPPFAGLMPGAPSEYARLFASPGPIHEAEAAGSDPWGAAEALHAAGIGAGDIALNTFSYQFTPGAFIIESGARALSCAVIPAGPGQTEQQIGALHAYRPSAYFGTPDFLNILASRWAETVRDPFPIRKALLSGAAFPQSLRARFEEAGIAAFEAYATAELGVIAFETTARAGLVAGEGLILEIVRPGTDDPVPEGEIGEVVATRLSRRTPFIRFGTGDLSRILPGASPCGRTNTRLAGWLGRADQRTKVKGMFVDPRQIATLARRHPELGRMRLRVTREGEIDRMVLLVEHATKDDALARGLAEALKAVTGLSGEVEIVAVGSLPADGKVIADERPIG